LTLVDQPALGRFESVIVSSVMSQRLLRRGVVEAFIGGEVFSNG